MHEDCCAPHTWDGARGALFCRTGARRRLLWLLRALRPRDDGDGAASGSNAAAGHRSGENVRSLPLARGFLLSRALQTAALDHRRPRAALVSPSEADRTAH